MAESVREAALDVIKAYDKGEDVRGAVANLRVLLGGDGGPTYVTPRDRHIVCLEVGYDSLDTPEQAVAAALSLTRDQGSPGTQWHVYDRQTGEGRVVEQSEVEDMLTDSGSLTFDLEG
jgi:hypothetical protein